MMNMRRCQARSPSSRQCRPPAASRAAGGHRGRRRAARGAGRGARTARGRSLSRRAPGRAAGSATASRSAARVEADIVQACVVTLEPVEAHIDEPSRRSSCRRTPSSAAQGFDDGGEILLDAEGPDSPETFSGDTIDVGALAEEFFGLAIDPYPRKPGVVAARRPTTPSRPRSLDIRSKSCDHCWKKH